MATQDAIRRPPVDPNRNQATGNHETSTKVQSQILEDRANNTAPSGSTRNAGSTGNAPGTARNAGDSVGRNTDANNRSNANGSTTNTQASALGAGSQLSAADVDRSVSRLSAKSRSQLDSAQAQANRIIYEANNPSAAGAGSHAAAADGANDAGAPSAPSSAPSDNSLGKLNDKFGQFVRDAHTISGGATTIAFSGSFDIGAYVQYVLREAYNSTTADMYVFAQKTQRINELKKKIRDELERARNFASTDSNYTSGDAKTLKEPGFTQLEFNTDPNATGAFSKDGEKITAKTKLDDYIKTLGEKLQTAGDDAQLAQVDLQNVLQKQQQTLQLMSNISKMLHDTAMSIIRKIG